MICLRCNSEEFEHKDNAVIEQEFRGETFKVKAPAMVCAKCGWQALAEGMADALLKRTGDAYRKRHGLLTSIEIKALREELGMSQQRFAEALGVGVASVKRWETWLPQETSSDNLIRLKAKELKRKPHVQEAFQAWESVNLVEDVRFASASGVTIFQVKYAPTGSGWGVPLSIQRRRKSIKVSRRHDTALAIAA